MGQEALSHHIKFLSSFLKRLRKTSANDEGQRKPWYSASFHCCRKSWVCAPRLWRDALVSRSHGGLGRITLLRSRDIWRVFPVLKIDCSLDTHVKVETTGASPFVTTWGWRKDDIWGLRHLILCGGGPCYSLAIFPLSLCWMWHSMVTQQTHFWEKCPLKYLSVMFWYPSSF